MITLQQLHYHIDQSYLVGGGSDAQCCKQIVSVILNDDRKFYTYGELLEGANAGSVKGFNISDVQFALNVLKGSSIKLLRETYRYIDDDLIYDLSVEELQLAMQDGVLELELRGYPDRDFKSKVFLIFSTDRMVVSNESIA
jgi:hypothetical protein